MRVLGVVVLAAAAWLARDALLLVFFAVLLAVMMSYPVGWLSRLLPRGLAVLAVLLLGLAGWAGVGAVAVPTLERQVGELRERAPRAIEQVRDRLQRAQLLPGGPSGKAARGQSGGGGGGAAVGEAVAKVAPAVLRVIGGVTEVVVLVVLAAFLVYEPDAYRRGLVLLVPREREEWFDELWARFHDGLRRWVGGIALEMAIMGTLVSIGLLVAGVHGWLALGVLTGLATFVPYLGAIATSIPGLLVALTQSPRHLALAALVYLCAHLVEGYLLSPAIMRRAVEVKPALLLGGQAVLGSIFGAVGILVATPAIVCAQIAVAYLWVERRLRKAPA